MKEGEETREGRASERELPLSRNVRVVRQQSRRDRSDQLFPRVTSRRCPQEEPRGLVDNAPSALAIVSRSCSLSTLCAPWAAILFSLSFLPSRRVLHTHTRNTGSLTSLWTNLCVTDLSGALDVFLSPDHDRWSLPFASVFERPTSRVSIFLKRITRVPVYILEYYIFRHLKSPRDFLVDFLYFYRPNNLESKFLYSIFAKLIGLVIVS